MIVSNYTIKNFFTFLWKRTLRIEPPYLLSIVIGCMYLFARNFVPGSAPVDLFPTWKEIALHLGYLIPFFEQSRWINNGYWTLAIEFQFYLVMAIIFPLALSQKIIQRVFFYAILIAFTLIWPNNDMFSGWAAYFLLGLSYILLYFKKINFIEYVIVSVIASLVTLYFRTAPDLLIAWGTIAIVRVAQDWENSFTKFYGDRSYSFYLLHSIIGAPIINFLSHRLMDFWHKPLVILLGFLMSTLAAHVFFNIIEKPSMKWSKNIKYKS